MRTWVLFGTIAASVASATIARADAKECIAASERGQSLRNDGKLTSAKVALAQCAAEACPAPIRKECAKQLGEVDDAIPTVVFGAKVDGRDVAAVSVKVDGALVSDRIDGRAIALDPGPHVFHFETSGRPPVEQSLILKQGEKNRAVDGVWGAAVVQPGAATPFGSERLATVTLLGKTDDATPILQARKSGRWFDACTAPCGRPLSLDSTYRITGDGVPKSTPFTLQGQPGEKLEVGIKDGDDGGKKTAIIVSLTGAGMFVLGAILFPVAVAVGGVERTYPPSAGTAATPLCTKSGTSGTFALGADGQCHETTYSIFYGLAATAGILGGVGLITGVVGLIMLAAGRADVTQSIAARVGPNGFTF